MSETAAVDAETIRLAHLEDRLHTVERALRYMGTVTEDELHCTLHYTRAHQWLKDSPNKLMYALFNASRVAQEHPDNYIRFSEWKIAQQICEAAGLPY
jgi:hypothetical protein